MRLTKIKTRGLKAHDIDLDLAPVQVVVGDNGAGKSSLLIAIYLLVLGRTSSPDTSTTALDSGVGLAATNDGVMSLASGHVLEVEGVWETDDGRVMAVRRTWKRSRGGKVTTDVDLTGFARDDGSLSKRDREGLIRQELSPALDLFFPADMLSLSPAKLRARLLRATPADMGAVSEWVPEGLPSWAQPAAEREKPLDWITSAKKRAAERVSTEQAERRRAEAVLDDLEDAWQDPKPADETITKLSNLREERDGAKAYAAKAAEVEALRADVARVRSLARVSPTDVEIADAENEVALQRSRASAHAAALAAFNVAQTTRDGWAADVVDVPDATPEDRQRADAALEQAIGNKDAVRAALQRAEGLLSAFGDACPLSECPHCRESLTEAWASAEDAARSEVARLSETYAQAAAQADRAAEALRNAEEGVDAARARAGLAEAEAELAAKQEALNTLPEPDVEGAEKRLRELYAAVQRGSATRAQLDDLEGRLELAEAELEEMIPPRALADIEREIADTEASLEALGEANARRRQREEAEDAVKICDEQIEAAKGWVAKLDEVHKRMLDGAKSWLEERLSAATGGRVCVELVDARGNDTCTITLNGCSVLGLSGGEMVMWLAATVLTLAEAIDCPWKPLLLDRLESVSVDRREAFLAAVVEMQAEGTISQALLTGCPDTPPTVSGAVTTWLGEESRRERAAA